MLNCYTDFIILKTFKTVGVFDSKRKPRKFWTASLKKWVNLKTHAFVKTYIETMNKKTSKKGSKLSEKGEPAMRKTLSSKELQKKFGHKSTPEKTISQLTADKKLKKAKCMLKKAVK